MDTIFTITEAAKFLGFKVQTLQKWDREGKLKPASRTATNRRVYTKNQLLQFLNMDLQKTGAENVAYCRVSSQAQKPDLANQQIIIEDFCRSKKLTPVKLICEIGGGLNFNRPKFLDLVDSIERREVQTLVIAHKDRLVRFGFEWFERFANKHGCSLVVLNQEKLSPEQEMVQDLMTIVHCFSSRLYGLRNYKKTLKKALENGNEGIQN